MKSKFVDSVYVDRETYNKLIQDRTDFGFDSIYFRYAIMRDELARLKAKCESHDWDKECARANADKMHFYNCLEQWTCAHEHLKEGKSKE